MAPLAGDAQRSHLSIQIRPLDPEGLRGFADSATVLLQHRGNVFALEAAAGLPEGAAQPERTRPAIQLDHGKDVVELNDRATHAMDEIMSAAEEHAQLTGLAPMWAVTLLDGTNDGPDHARALADRAARFTERTGVRPRITIVPYNSIGKNDPFKRSTHESAFRDELAQCGFFSHKRYSGGADVQAACGQLVADHSFV